MKRTKSRAWLVIDPLIGFAFAAIIMVQWTKGFAAHIWGRL